MEEWLTDRATGEHGCSPLPYSGTGNLSPSALCGRLRRAGGFSGTRGQKKPGAGGVRSLLHRQTLSEPLSAAVTHTTSVPHTHVLLLRGHPRGHGLTSKKSCDIKVTFIKHKPSVQFLSNTWLEHFRPKKQGLARRCKDKADTHLPFGREKDEAMRKVSSESPH